MPIHQIPQKIFTYHPKGRRGRVRPVLIWKDRFTYPEDQKRPKRLKLVADDDEINIISMQSKHNQNLLLVFLIVAVFC
jgi:hypothetical protein